MLFHFELKKPLECLFPKGESEEDRHVCWFYLTDSQYYIDLGKAKLFESSPKWLKKYNRNGHLSERFLDYQYSRQLEDLFEILPQISCPIPDYLYLLIETDEKRKILYDKLIDIWDAESSEEWTQEDERYDNIIRNLIQFGYLDSGYLRFRSECQFFHAGENVIINYNFIDKDEDGCPVWSAGKGSYTLKYTDFIYEIEDLLSRFFTAMDKQVETAMQVFHTRELEKSNLEVEHAQRKKHFYDILESIKKKSYENLIDWSKITTDLESYIYHIGKFILSK